MQSTSVAAQQPPKAAAFLQSFTALPASDSDSVPTQPAVRARRPKFPFRGGGFVSTVVIGDFVMAGAALSLAWWLRFHTGLAYIGTGDPIAAELANYWGHILLGAVLMSAGLVFHRAYDYSLLLGAAHNLTRVVQATLVWLVAYLSLSLMLKFSPPVSRIFCALSPVCLIVLLSYWRLIVSHYIAPGQGARSLCRRILFIGWTPELRRIADHAIRAQAPELEIAGVLLPSGNAPLPPNMPRDLEVLGRNYDELPQLLEREPCDGVIVGDPDLDGERLATLATICEKEMVDFEIVPACFPVLRSGLLLRQICGVPVVGVNQLPLHSHANVLFKRAIDILGALAGLVLSAPIIGFFAFLIYRESPGPIFYRQRRVGINGRPFDILKLRSMKLNAEANARPGWTVKDDPRCLRIGKLMRALNIDELPQFWNVLKGDMSLVGPRPERPELIQKFREIIPNYNARHHIKPGITGWAQVNGLRGDTDLTERVRYDLHYIENWNPWLDLKIILMTLLSRKGAC